MKNMKSIKWKSNGIACIVLAAVCGGWKWALLTFIASAQVEWFVMFE